MKVILPATSTVIKERGRQLSRYIYDFDIEMYEVEHLSNKYVAMVKTNYIGTKLYKLSFWAEFTKDGSQVKFRVCDCNCPHKVDVCKHLYGATLAFANDQANLYNILETFREEDLQLEETLGDSSDWIADEEDRKNQTLKEFLDNEVVESIEPEFKVAPKLTNEYTESLLNIALANQLTKFEQSRYQFMPELIIGENKYELKLKVNINGGKSFVIKDIYELPTLFKHKLIKTFGTNTEIPFVIDQFKNKSLVEFLIRETARSEALLSTISSRGKTDWYGYYTPGKIQYDKKQLQLTVNSLFELLRILNGNAIKVKYEQERLTTYVVEKSTQKFNVEYEELENCILIESRDMLEVINTDNHLVAIDPINNIIRLHEVDTVEQAQILSLLLGAPHTINSDNAFIFSKTVLNEVKEYLNSNIDISKLCSGVEFVGVNTHVELLKDKLTLAVKFNLPQQKDPNIEYKIDDLSYMQVDRLLSLYGDEPLDISAGNKIVIKGINQIIDFVQDSLHNFEHVSEVLTSNEEFKNFKLIKKVPITISASTNKKSTILKFESSEFSDSELLEILKGLENTEQYLAIGSGKIVDLTSDEVKKVIETANQLDINLSTAESTDFEIELASIFYYNRIFEALDIETKSDQTLEQLVLDYNSLSSKSYRKSKNLSADLRNYQKQGVNWLDFLNRYNFGGILADDMGLGKTLQVIAHLTKQISKLPTLIVTPASLVYNWKHEFEKFTINLIPLVLDGQVATRTKLINTINNQICIISYDSFKRDFEKLSDLEFNYVILDEAQHIKNSNTKISKAVKALDCNHRLALTGTPIENNLHDLWSLFEFIMPGYLGTSKEFKRKYITPIENGDSEVQAKLKRRVMPFIMRRLKGDVLTELPTKTEKTIHIQMDEKQQKLYDAQASLIKKFLEQTSDDEIKTKQIEILAMITKLRQIACNPRLIDSNYNGESAKQEYLIDHLQTLNTNGHKTVLFSQFVSNFDYLEHDLKASEIEYYKITGSTAKQARYELVEKFNSNQVPVFLISLKAGGTGLNITGADTVIHYDPWWNTAVESQATDRVHRMGQEKNVFVYKLICEKTIEEQIVKLQEKKRKLAENLLESDSIKSSALTKDDIFNLF